MPKFEVKTNMGNFEVELNRPPTSHDELMQAVEAKIAASGGQMKVAPAPAPEQPAPQQQGAPITAQPPRFPGVEKAAREYAIPTATAAAGLLSGGASLGAQALIGGGGEALTQLAAGKELDPTSIGVAAALPGVATGVSKAAGYLTRSVANQVSRQPMQQAAAGIVEKKLGVGAAATQKLAQAGAKTTPVHDFTDTFNVLDDIIKKEPRLPGGSKGAKEFAEDTLGKLTDPSQPPFKYNEIFESSQAVREAAEAAGDNRTKRRIYEIREALIKDIDKLGPEAKEAFQLYRKQQAVKEVSTVITGPGFVGNKITALLKSDPLVAGAFSAAEKKTLETIANKVGPEGLQKILAVAGGLGASGGTAMTAPLIIGALIAVPKVGDLFARSLIAPNGSVSQVVWPAFAQYMRGRLSEQEAN